MAARDGDTIALAAGTYRGGVTIDASVTIRGAGARGTVIRGGGPVLTIGRYHADIEPTVTIEGVTITGGVTTSWPEADEAGLPGVEARGGGILVPPSIDGGLGASVTLKRVAITNNRVATTATQDFDTVAYAAATGGGIDSWGALTLDHVVVSGNRVGAAAGLGKPGMSSDADGGGILQHQGDLTIRNSVISRNVASATAPNGRYAEAGGLYVDAGAVTVTDTVIKGNVAELSATMPASIEVQAQPGGVLIHGDVVSATFERTRIVGNRALMSTTTGFAFASAAGINAVPGVPFTLSHSTLARNVATAVATGSGGEARASFGAAAVTGTITETAITDNMATAISRHGSATAAVGGVSILGSLIRCLVSGNSVYGRAAEGTVVSFAGGVWVAEEALTLRGTRVTDNRVTAEGQSGWARGGGIYAGPTPDGIGPSTLRLIASPITRNEIRAALDLDPAGGGLYRRGAPLVVRRSPMTANAPDNCVGCGPAMQRRGW